MGGCYGSSYGHSSPCSTPRPAAEPMDAQSLFKRRFKQYLKSGDRADLQKALQALNGEHKGVINLMHQAAGIDAAVKDFSDFEIEAKFEIDLQRRNGKKAKEPAIEEIMDTFDMQFSPGALWIKDPVNAVATGQNRFFGTEDGEERVVIITKGGGVYLKEKGSVEPYSFGIPAEEYILRRRETRVATTLDACVAALLRHNKDGKLRDMGIIEKVKGDFFLINAQSGTEIGCSVTDSYKLPEREKRQLQLELEYAGQIPGFPAPTKQSERAIVEEMSRLYRGLLVTFGVEPVPINADWQLQLTPTVERKYDFVSGNGHQARIPADRDKILESLNLARRGRQIAYAPK